jgi:hypothetical protein
MFLLLTLILSLTMHDREQILLAIRPQTPTLTSSQVQLFYSFLS